MSDEYLLENRAWEVATVIRLVSSMDIDAVCGISKKLSEKFTEEQLDKIDDKILFDAYCTYR